MTTTDGQSGMLLLMRWQMQSQRLGSARRKVRDMLQILLLMPKIRAIGRNAAAVPSLGQGRGAFATRGQGKMVPIDVPESPKSHRRYLPYDAQSLIFSVRHFQHSTQPSRVRIC